MAEPSQASWTFPQPPQAWRRVRDEDSDEEPDPLVAAAIRRKKAEWEQVGGGRSTTSASGDWEQCVTRKLGRYLEPVDHSWIIQTSTLSFRRVHMTLQKMGWGLLGALTLSAIVLPEIRSYLVNRSWTGSFLIFLLEFGSWAGLTFVLGSTNKCPVNYVPLVIMRIFISLQLQYEATLAADRAEAKSIRRSSWWLPSSIYDMNNLRFFYHRWAASWGFGDALSPPTRNEEEELGVAAKVLSSLGADSLPLPVNVVLGATFFFAGWFATKFSTLRVDKLGNAMLTLSFISSASGAFILVSSLAMDRFGPGFHLTLVSYWVPFALVTVWILAFYLLQRLLCAGEEYWRKRRWAEVEFAWMALEILLCIIQTSVVLHYIPAIHRSYDASEACQMSLRKSVLGLVPSGMKPMITEDIWSIVTFARNMLEQYYGFLPLAMGVGVGGPRPN